MTISEVLQARRGDVIWNYVGTIVSMGSGFILLPILLAFLSADELGLWYAFLAVSNFTLLFEFGFSPTFARNIVYCLSGVSSLSREGKTERGDEIDWHLFASILKTSKLIYAGIALVALLISVTLGSVYVASITSDLEGLDHWLAWGVFCVSIFLNLYYLWTITFLRGFGDVAGESRAKTFAKVSQLVVTALLCVIGLGLMGAAIGFLLNGILLRAFAKVELRRHEKLLESARTLGGKVSRGDVKSVLDSVSHLAVRDGLVQLSLYFATQASSIVCSLYLGLAETGTYSLQLQLANAVGSLCIAYISSFYPSYQSAYTRDDVAKMREIVERGFSVFWACAIVGIGGVILVVYPLLPLVKPGVSLDAWMFVALAVYTCLLQQYSAFCSLIVATNRIPYVRAYVLASVCGILCSIVLIRVFGLGAWGLVFGQAIVQLAYNDWHWPGLVMSELGLGYLSALREGYRWLGGRLSRRLSR